MGQILLEFQINWFYYHIMDNIKKIIEFECEYIEWMIRGLEVFYGRPVKGYLKKRSKKHVVSYLYYESRTHKPVYYGTDKAQKVMDFKRAKYSEARLRILKEDLRLLNMIKDRIRPYDPESVLSTLPKIYHDGAPEVYPYNAPFIGIDAPKSSHECKAVIKKKSNNYRQGGLLNVTYDGTLVRSKGELIIYDMLLFLGVKFVYEQDIIVKGITYHPDFAIFLKDGTIIFWEHIGKLYSNSYMKTFLTRLRNYESHGIILGKNLIITVDFKDSSIDANAIRKLIKNNILPYAKKADE